ncbi:MAG: hypothetical protein KA535_09450 [Azonexus sp.]|nr:hypothetical protein [Azonexus sp.]
MAPAWGHVHFRAGFLHPSTVLLVCLTGIVVIQFLGYGGLGLVLLLLLSTFRRILPGWRVLLRRLRWLLLSVWLILAYGTAGDALFDLAWLPTHEGAAEATLHVARLVLMLGCLAWMFARLGRQGLLVALVSLLRPLSRRGVATDRLVVRLSLVMENLQTELPKGAWRSMLDGDAGGDDGPAKLQVEVPSWHLVDYLACLGVLVLSIGAVALG